VPRDGRWEPLTGNQIGALLADHLLRRTEGSDRLVVDTVVSSRLLAAMAADHGVHHERTLTGFKWIVRPAVVHPEWRFVFGYEEALGFSVDAYVRDKDAITAGLVFAELVADLARAGSTVWDRLEELARRYGLHATETWSVRFDPDGDRRRHDVMASLFDRPPARLAERRVIDVVDYRAGNGLPSTDLIELVLEGDVRVAVRPSGTEPRIKVYAEVVVDVADGDAGLPRAEATARRLLDTLRASVVPLIGGSSTAPVG
jgi:phosphomannomutase